MQVIGQANVWEVHVYTISFDKEVYVLERSRYNGGARYMAFKNNYKESSGHYTVDYMMRLHSSHLGNESALRRT